MRKDLVKRNKYLKYMLGIPLATISLLLSSAVLVQREMKVLGNKYFNHLTDYELD
jgi:hypothetical protein